MTRAAFGARPLRWRKGLFGCGLAEAVTEALDAATHVVNGLLGARVEGVRFAGGIQLEQRVFLAFEGFGFLRVHAGAGHELEAVGQVREQNFAVVGVNAFFHDLPYQLREPRQPCATTAHSNA